MVIKKYLLDFPIYVATYSHKNKKQVLKTKSAQDFHGKFSYN